MISLIKRFWEKIDGRVLFLAGLIIGWATKGVLLWLKNWIVGQPVLKILFGWLF